MGIHNIRFLLICNSTSCSQTIQLDPAVDNGVGRISCDDVYPSIAFLSPSTDSVKTESCFAVVSGVIHLTVVMVQFVLRVHWIHVSCASTIVGNAWGGNAVDGVLLSLAQSAFSKGRGWLDAASKVAGTLATVYPATVLAVKGNYLVVNGSLAGNAVTISPQVVL